MRVQLVVTVVILFVVSIASVYFWKYRQSKVDPLLAVLIMVKNEESVMRATLEPFLKAGLPVASLLGNIEILLRVFVQ